MALNMRAIQDLPTYRNREKGEIEDLHDVTLDFFSCQNTTNEDEEPDVLISFVTKEDKEHFFFASSALKNFLIDNVNEAEDKDGALSFPGYEITISYGGKKKSKNGRKYNVWEVTARDKD